MKLYVLDESGNKIHLTVTAQTRSELAEYLERNYVKINDKTYSISDVYAEKSIDNTAIGMAAGGVLGVAGGPAGVFFGGIIGGLFGRKVEDDEERKIERFNNSSFFG